MPTPDYLTLFNNMRTSYNSTPIDQRLKNRGFVQSFNESGEASWSPGDAAYADAFTSNIIKGWGDDTSAADRNNSAAAWNPRDFVNQYHVLPLDSAEFNGNTDYSDATAVSQGFNNLNEYLSALDGGNGGHIENVPGMGRVFVPGNPDTFDWTRDFTSAKHRGGINGFADDGGIVKLIAMAITGGAAAGAMGGVEAGVEAGATAGGADIAYGAGDVLVNNPAVFGEGVGAGAAGEIPGWAQQSLTDGSITTTPSTGLEQLTSAYNQIKPYTDAINTVRNLLPYLNNRGGVAPTAAPGSPPEAAPAPSDNADSPDEGARDRQRTRAQGTAGRGSTILTSPLGIVNAGAGSPLRTILG